MIEEYADLIAVLAASLQVTTDYLIEIFAKRAWTEFLPAIVFLPAVAACLVAARFSYRYGLKVKAKYSKEHNYYHDDHESFYILSGFLIVVSVILAFICLLGTIQGVKAIASPEAYAVQEILKSVK